MGRQLGNLARNLSWHPILGHYDRYSLCIWPGKLEKMPATLAIGEELLASPTMRVVKAVPSWPRLVAERQRRGRRQHLAMRGRRFSDECF